MSSTPEHKEQQSAKFSIDLLPIQNREDKFSYMTNLSLIQNCDLNNLTKLWMTGNINRIKFTGSKNEFLITQLNTVWVEKDSSDEISVDNIRNCWMLLFKVNSIEISHQNIIISTSDNEKFIGITEKYLEEWVKELSKKNDWEINTLINTQKQSQKHYIESGLLNIKTNQLLNIAADDYCVTDESSNELCILKDNTIATYIYDNHQINRQSDYFDLSTYGTIKNIRTDANNNFYFIICEKEWVSQLKILNRKSLEEILYFPDLTEIVYLSNETGKLLCMDKEWYLRIVTINTKSLGRGYIDSNEITAESTASAIVKIEDKSRSDLKNILKSGGISLSSNTEQALDQSEDQDDSTLREQLRSTVVDGMDGKTLQELYSTSSTPKDINTIYQIALQLKQNPHVMSVKWLIDPIMAAIISKRDMIRLADMWEQLQTISTELTTINDFTWLISIKNRLISLKHERSQIVVVDKQVDTLLKETLQVIDQKIKEYQEEHKESLISDIENNCKLIQDYMDSIDFVPQITSIYNTLLRKDTESMLQYLEPEERKWFKKKMSDIVNTRQVALIKQIKEWEKSWLQTQEETVNEIKNKLTNIRWIIGSIIDENTLKSLEISDPLVLQIRTDIEQLPINKWQELSQKLDQIFKERQLSIQFSNESTWSSLKSLDQYGIPKSLYFVPDTIKKVKWDISAKQTKDGYFKLQFTSSTGNIIEPSVNKKILGNFKFTYSFDEWQELKKIISERNSNGIQKKYEEYKKDAETNKNEIESIEKKYYVPRMLEVMNQISGEWKWRNMHDRKNLLSIDNKTVITPTIEKSLSTRWRILSQQLQHKQWIMIVESEAGTGKNFKCDILWHLTNREVFDVSCNEYMEKEDLLFSPEIDNDGTHRKPSKLVQWLQTPGAIIVLDEINTLKPGVSKLLNPLLDGRRYINDPQMGRVHAHPSVIIIGLMNPRYYRGTKELPQEFISRSRVTNDAYPEPKEEAFMISRYIDWPLGKLSQEEFNNYRNEYIIRDEKPSDKTIYNIFVWLHKVTKIAKKIREIYSKSKKWDANIWEELDYVFTIRDGNYIIQDFNHTKDIKQSIDDVVLMKIADPEQKEYTKGIIDAECSQ